MPAEWTTDPRYHGWMVTYDGWRRGTWEVVRCECGWAVMDSDDRVAVHDLAVRALVDANARIRHKGA